MLNALWLLRNFSCFCRLLIFFKNIFFEKFFQELSVSNSDRPDLGPNCLQRLSPYLTGLRLFCDNWRQTSREGRKAVSKQSPVIRNFLACVAKWRKVVTKILNMFKNFMRQNSSQNGRKVIAGVSKPSRTCRRLLAI